MAHGSPPPGHTSVALASLIIGVSLSAGIFSLLNAVLLRPIPVPDPDQLAVLLEKRPDGTNHNFSYPDFTDYRAAQRTLVDLAAYSRADVTVRQPAGSHIVAAELVSGSYFQTLGVRLRFGRGLVDTDDRVGAAPVVVASESLRRQIAGPAADEFAPRPITINALDFSIVGVAARRSAAWKSGATRGSWRRCTSSRCSIPRAVGTFCRDGPRAGSR